MSAPQQAIISYKAAAASSPVTNNTGFTVTANYSSTDRMGYTMAFNNNTNITKVTVDASVSPSTAYILNHATHAVVASVAFVGSVATFASPVAVTTSDSYDVIVDNGGSSWTTAYRNDNNLPANNTDINFTQITYYNGSWTSLNPPSGSPVGGIISVTTQA